MFSEILEWIRKITKDDTKCIAEADALVFEVLELEPFDPNYNAAVDRLVQYIGNCSLLGERAEYKALLTGLAMTGHHTNTAA